MTEGIGMEADYIRKTPLEHRKKFAQFFTPEVLADIMTGWLVEKEDLHTVLEPAFGLGIFTRQLQKKKEGLKIKGFDIDERIFNESKKKFGTDVNILLQD